MRIGLARRRAAKELRGVRARLRGKTSLADRTGYRDACGEAATNDDAFTRFRRDPRYTPVVETAGPEHGAAYLRLALERAPELAERLDAFRDNDLLGSPTLANYGAHGSFSPTTLRYVKVLADLRMLFGPLDGFDIVEIGGGFGGQALVCSRSATLSSYTLVDLPEAAALQRVYLERLGVERFRAVTQDALDEHAEYDLVISNYAFSELTRPIQKRYLKDVLLRSRRGYLSLNYHSPRAYRTLTTQDLLDVLPGSRVLPLDDETAVERKARIDILVWGRT